MTMLLCEQNFTTFIQHPMGQIKDHRVKVEKRSETNQPLCMLLHCMPNEKYQNLKSDDSKELMARALALVKCAGGNDYQHRFRTLNL